MANLKWLVLLGAIYLHTAPAHAEICGMSLSLQRICGTAYINQSISIFLATRPGERVMRPDYGFDFSPYKFEIDDPERQAALVEAVRKALEENFPDITFQSLRLNPADDQYLLEITYLIDEDSAVGILNFIVF